MHYGSCAQWRAASEIEFSHPLDQFLFLNLVLDVVLEFNRIYNGDLVGETHHEPAGAFKIQNRSMENLRLRFFDFFLFEIR